MFVSGLIPVYICLIQAAAVNHIPAEIITSIISVEGGRHGLAVANKNNTEDLGIMQINTGAWLSLVSNVFFDSDSDRAYQVLKNDDCFNIQVGTWILRRSIILENGDLWEGVGRYHSSTLRLKKRYIKKVKARYVKLFHKNIS
ncbi:lytic transglycosylase domain-containing protein [Salmonella enterica subsp. enterica serovar Teshie]|uniref:Lytic transglycosylase domain-containing protein n=2 Tax=Salmonella enterica TaxID=28901 RepID=A0A763SSI3_SALER|nr:lytic transglycosylase domain-containing protein [Salmonella enterica]EBR9812273.1 lytic transglycosylase [Salmonella enterica subsp. enterica serovar Teshie]ECA1252520.1 lytic transglycosylase [Salmonella enterica subsp. enterica serovar Chailey]ECA7544096.1 lytic transglycosylase [Salmonella enterica subsp. enterica serovar Strasbourg]ECD6620747.1 lytic transglycosylase [Salmonella enterica subsp. enterica]EDU0501886.1 lytic transglycosylase domain-containing protein [Salmonella enterica 